MPSFYYDNNSNSIEKLEDFQECLYDIGVNYEGETKISSVEILGEEYTVEAVGKLARSEIVERAFQLKEFYDRQDKQTIATKFFSGTAPDICDLEKMLTRTVLGIYLRDAKERIVGYAELLRLGNTPETEIGIVTDVNCRRKGLGMLLVRNLISESLKDPELGAINGYVCNENLGIRIWTRKMIEKGLPISMQYVIKQGVYWVRIDLAELRRTQEIGNF